MVSIHNKINVTYVMELFYVLCWYMKAYLVQLFIQRQYGKPLPVPLM